jgi:hypothetical protein
MIIPANTEQKDLFLFLTLQDEITESLIQSPWAAGRVSLGLKRHSSFQPGLVFELHTLKEP